jgi:hypothetical protein
MRAKKAAGEIERFPYGRKSGPRWVTPRMWERRQMETMQRLRAEREALEPPRPRRGRPTIIAQAQAQIVKAFVQLPEHSPLLAHLHGRLRERVAEARAQLAKRGRPQRTRPRPDF